MQLTENEKREIISLLEKDRPLPDKYRFLLFDDKREVELVWNGKTNEICNVNLPFQVIEQVDEPRKVATGDYLDGGLFDFRGRQKTGWTNKLIWGDNKLILSSLKNGIIRNEIEKAGGIKLIYIDPPFDVGADFSMDIEIGDDSFTKRANVLEELAYRDTWGKGADSFISMIYERLVLMRDLLADDGSIYVHCDYRLNSQMRLVLSEIFGENNYMNEIIWQKIRTTKAQSRGFGIVHDSIFLFSKSLRTNFTNQYRDFDKNYIETHYKSDENGRMYRTVSLLQRGQGSEKNFNGRVLSPPTGMHWIWSQERIDEAFSKGLIRFTSNGRPEKIQYLDEMKGDVVDDLWTDIYPINSQANEDLNYPTQKPEALLERVIRACSNENDIVADFFCGSGTTLAVAEKLNRKWLGSDLGKFAIHTTRKRMIQVQRSLKDEGKDFRAFEVLNLGKYERAHYIGVNQNLREEEQQKQLAQKETDFNTLILKAYKAELVENYKCFYGKKAGRMVSIGPINQPVSRLFVEEIILECHEKRISRVDILAFEFEMGLFPNIQEEAKSKGIDLVLKYIPREVFDKRAIEKNQVVFYDVAFIEVKPHQKKNTIAIELTDFSVYYSQDSVENVASSLKDGKNKIVVENGQIIKVSKDANGIISRETLTKSWSDWIDYWSVDFSFETKREIVRVKNEETGQVHEMWTGDYIFENEWQSFRTKENRSLELKTPFHELEAGKKKIAVKVVDIFGNDTMKIIELNMGGK